MSTNSHFRDLLRAFNECQTKYLVVGGYAVMNYAEPRYTKDLGVWVGTAAVNAAAVFNALKAFGAPLSGITKTTSLSKDTSIRLESLRYA
jgi:hypothetical protein